jgi:manganese efflux pump family protein
MLSALILALALAADATAVAAVRGLVAREVRPRDALTLAGLFGGFQGGMAAIGWLGGAQLGSAVARFDHWIAFVLLAGLGLRTLWAAWRGGDDDDATSEPFALGPLVVMALATSIDALAAGVTLPLLSPWPPVTLALIAAVTFAASLAAVALGRRLGPRFRAGVEVIGGLALIGIGIQILVEHLA